MSDKQPIAYLYSGKTGKGKPYQSMTLTAGVLQSLLDIANDSNKQSVKLVIWQINEPKKATHVAYLDSYESKKDTDSNDNHNNGYKPEYPPKKDLDNYDSEERKAIQEEGKKEETKQETAGEFNF